MSGDHNMRCSGNQPSMIEDCSVTNGMARAARRMTPTMRLRFVERRIHTTHYRILQQWWAGFTDAYETDIEGEWRDVPVESEE